MKNIKSRGEFLLEKYNKDLILEAGIQSNNAKWSETLVGKLFKGIFKIITLNGFLVDKFKDIFSAKSFIIKNLARKLEKAIDALPGEYVERNNEIDFQKNALSFYDNNYSLLDILQKETSVKEINKLITNNLEEIKTIKNDLDLTKKDQKDFYLEIEKYEENLEKVKENVDNILIDMNDDDKYDFSKVSKGLGDKIEFKKKREDYKYKLLNAIKDSKDNQKISTSSIYKIISIINKARDVYMEADDDGETIYKSNKRETVFSPNDRLFNIWEDRVMKILSKKADIIPQSIKDIIGNSLASVDPIKYNVKLSSGQEKNILSSLEDVNNALDQIKSREKKSKKNSEFVDDEKSKSTNFVRKEHKDLNLNSKTFIDTLIELHSNKLLTTLFTPAGDDTEDPIVTDDARVFFIPKRVYVNGMVLGIVSLNPKAFDGLKTTSNGIIKLDNFSYKLNEFATLDEGFYYGVMNTKHLYTGLKDIRINIFNPGAMITANKLEKTVPMDFVQNLFFQGYINTNIVYGDDGKVAGLDSKFLEQRFDLKSTNYKAVAHFFKGFNF